MGARMQVCQERIAAMIEGLVGDGAGRDGSGGWKMSKEFEAEPRDHLILKGRYYYRPNRCGYTPCASLAGRYTKSEAEREAEIEPWHMRAVPLSEFRVAPPEAVVYVQSLRDLGFLVLPPNDMLI